MQETQSFIEQVWHYYHQNQRTLLWRVPAADGSFDPYKILVSEMMLQQTQVARVSQKYEEFLARFPTLKGLAKASLGDVLREWQGLGYNRRAKFLWQAAQKISSDYKGVFPKTVEELVTLPGVGTNTAAAICCYAFNSPVPFIETNIRTVFIHHFFADAESISDAQLWPVIKSTWDTEHPREWGWALMDYGSHLKQTAGNASRRSKHHVKQSIFEGSKRQIRGQVLRVLSADAMLLSELQKECSDIRLTAVLDDLVHEEMVERDANGYRLT